MTNSEKNDSKKAFLAAVTEAIEMLPLDFNTLTTRVILDPPSEPVKKNDEVAGEMTANQKLIYSALDQLREKIINAKNGTAEDARITAALEVLKNIMYISINTSLDVYDRSRSELKEGFQVVVHDEERHPHGFCSIIEIGPGMIPRFGGCF